MGMFRRLSCLAAARFGARHQRGARFVRIRTERTRFLRGGVQDLRIPGEDRAAARTAHVASMPRTILLAEDHEDNRAALLMVLEHGGYRALGARNGREAVEMANEHLPDLVLMDLAMPVMDGRAAMRILKAGERTAHIPIVVITAMALSVDRANLEAEGFDGLLIKPCPPPQLLAEVRRVIGPPDGN